MTNNDLIPRKEVEKMMQEKIYGLYRVINDEGEPQDEYLSEPQIALKELLQELSQIEGAGTYSGWIPVTEKTPNTDEKVFTYCNGVPTIAMKIYSGEWVEAYDYEGLGNNVKFWQPLPPPPITNKV